MRKSEVEQGYYAKKQIYCQDKLIAWSHHQRFKTALQIGKEFARKKILDYGCGDGTFLALIMRSPFAPFWGVGAERYLQVVEDCRKRFSDQNNLKFILDEELGLPEHQGTYDGVICMEVFEHVVDIEKLLNKFNNALIPSGKLLVSVPIETGLPLILKQAVRTIAGWRKIGDYPGTASYTFQEYCKSIFAGNQQHIERPVYQGVNGTTFYDHKGFNWKAFRNVLTKSFIIEKTFTSPILWASPQFATQIYFLARKM